MRSMLLVLVAACSSSSASKDPDLEKFAAAAKPVATSAHKLKTDIDDFKSGIHSPTALFASDGPLVQVVTLYEAMKAMAIVKGTGTAKVCTDAWYGATAKLEDIVGGAAKTLGDLKTKAESPSMTLGLKLAAEWEKKSDDFDDAVCALRTAAATCVAAMTAAKIDAGDLALLASVAKDCAK